MPVFLKSLLPLLLGFTVVQTHSVPWSSLPALIEPSHLPTTWPTIPIKAPNATISIPGHMMAPLTLEEAPFTIGIL